MTKKRTPKKTTILIIISIISMLIFSNFDLTKEMLIPLGEKYWLLPVPALFPVFFLFLYINITYLKFSYAEGKNLAQKICFGLLNTAIFIFIFYIGFIFWKYSLGDIDVAFFGKVKKVFQLNFRNLFFWVFYQSIFMAYGVSILKIMVSKMKK
ncbi:hypothetical protein [Flavicella sp.]|uniref:hypothetical protein n=1 Tax=Flavicella sp. TaxID=2957742 RepID=UPI003019DFCC